MIEIAMFKPFLVSILIGALLGLEREKAYHDERTPRNFAGIRTFTLISLLGTLSAMLADIFTKYFVLGGFIAFFMFIIVVYYITSTVQKDIGATTEITAVLTYLFGILCYTKYLEMAVAFAVITVLVVSTKSFLHGFVKKVKLEEIYDTIKFAIIAFVILPILPNKTYGPLSVFNPYIVWLMVVFISGISFAAYVLIKIIGAKRGIGLTGFLGGLVSSTAVTNSMAIDSKRTKGLVGPFVFATIIASTTMFIRVLIEVYVLNKALLKSLAYPMIVMTIIGIICAFIIWRKKSKAGKNIEFYSPFTLGPALKFGLFFAFVLFLAKAAQIYLGDSGVYLAAFVSGLADVDAITVSMANLAGKGIAESVAVKAITIAACTNTAVKLGMAVIFGSKTFAKHIAIVFSLMLAGGILTLLLV